MKVKKLILRTTEMTHKKALIKTKGNEVYVNTQRIKTIFEPEVTSGDIGRTAVKKIMFSKSDAHSWSIEFVQYD